MKIQPNSVVALTYDLYIKENGEELFVEKADEQNPLVFLYAVGMMLPKFEEKLMGLSVGDTYDFHLVAEDAYGNIDDAAIAELPLDMFGEMEKPEIGAILPLQDDEGNHFNAKVKVISDLAVTVDLNHPMAGRDLHFIGKVISIREATSEELSHGHAHGADGHERH